MEKEIICKNKEIIPELGVIIWLLLNFAPAHCSPVLAGFRRLCNNSTNKESRRTISTYNPSRDNLRRRRRYPAHAIVPVKERCFLVAFLGVDCKEQTEPKNCNFYYFCNVYIFYFSKFAYRLYVCWVSQFVSLQLNLITI